MAKAFGIVNTSGNHIWVEGMQNYRPIGAFSFLGRYRVIDFSISNMSNSEIERIQVFAGNNPRSLIEHLGIGRQYDINPKTGKLQILFSESHSKNDIYNTDIAAFYENLDSIQKMKEEYVVIAPSYMVFAMDFEKLLKRSDSARHDKECVCIVFHYLLAFPHGIRLDKLVAKTANRLDLLVVEKFRDNAKNMPACRAHAVRRRPHKSVSTATEYERMSAGDHFPTHFLHFFLIFRIDRGRRRPVYTNSHSTIFSFFYSLYKRLFWAIF
jgi:hypothetical protein